MRFLSTRRTRRARAEGGAIPRIEAGATSRNGPRSAVRGTLSAQDGSQKAFEYGGGGLIAGPLLPEGFCSDILGKGIANYRTRWGPAEHCASIFETCGGRILIRRKGGVGGGRGRPQAV